MPVSPTYPGVYVQEVPSGVRTIVGVSTSTTLFIGRTKMGPLNKAIRLTTYSDYARAFGEDNLVSDMTRQLRMFFLNGGTDCYVVRIAQGAQRASVQLRGEGSAPPVVLTLTAKNPGVVGNSIRAAVTYSGAYPEATFNVELFRWEIDSQGQKVKADREEWLNLTMDPASPSYAPTVLTQKSALVNATDPAPGTGNGFSLSGLPVQIDPHNKDTFRDRWSALFGATQGTRNQFQISLDGSPVVTVDLQSIDVVALCNAAASLVAAVDAVRNAIAARIRDALVARLGSYPNPACDVTFEEVIPTPAAAPPAAQVRLLKITSNAPPAVPGRDVRVFPAADPARDIAVRLRLGQGQGGLEVGTAASRRPAPTGISTRPVSGTVFLGELGQITQATINITLNELNPAGTAFVDKVIGLPLDVGAVAPHTLWVDAGGVTPLGTSDGIREKLGIIRDTINNYQTANATKFPWRAELSGYRLSLSPLFGDDNMVPTSFASTLPAALQPHFTTNVRYYTLGFGGVGSFQTPGATGNDGTAPIATDYRAAYEMTESEVDLFNIMVLPRDHSPAVGADLEQLWGEASVYCQKRRAFLVMDPPASWTGSQVATNTVANLRVGLVKDYSAVYFPRLQIVEDGNLVNLGPSGAIAGLYARMDANRGVWKAPAGSEADIRGVVGVDLRLSDAQNGQLNPLGINTIRLFPEGVVSWGARTNAGADAFASEYKYIPIRRLALFIEETLYRGLKWVVFEPNDEGLWAQIRLNVGAFMHGLFRQGAFQGTKPSDAYFVKCDAETTTQNDRNLGMVNIWVGFAPLKPAEFVILYLQQIAGQIQT